MARPDRLPDWQGRLQTLIAEAATRPFAWGDWDCAQFAFAGVEAVTGRLLRPAWSYAARAEGIRLIRADGYRDHIAYLRAHCPAVDAGRARPGDLAVMPGAALGIIQGRAVYQVTPAGLGVAPLAFMLEALAV